MLSVVFCLVVGITDGDTLTARCGEPGQYRQEKIRLAGIDAPERKQPYGNKARQALSALCHEQAARITIRSKDRYGRTIADVQCKGQDAAAYMVSAGLAMVYTQYAKDHQLLVPLQESAKAARAGQWRMLDTAAPPVPPWQWRKK